MRIALAAAFVAFALTGCRDYIVEPPQPAPPPAQPGEPTSEAPPLALKGPSFMYVDRVGQYKAEAVSGAVTYEFDLRGPYVLLLRDDNDTDRFLNTRALESGRATLTATARDADNRIIAYAEREIEVFYD